MWWILLNKEKWIARLDFISKIFVTATSLVTFCIVSDDLRKRFNDECYCENCKNNCKNFKDEDCFD
jgi:hypothetical protein